MIGLTLIIIGLSYFAYLGIKSKNRVLSSSGVYYSTKKSLIDPDIGFVFKPNIEVEVARIDNKKLTLTFNFATDEFGRRQTKAENSSPEFLVYYGCSFAFGFGLNDDMILSSQLADQIKSHQVYNYNSNAYGVTQLLSYLRVNRWEKEIPQDKGILVYSFIRDHFNRIFPSPSNFNESPFYDFRGDKLEFKGLLNDVFPEEVKRIEENFRDGPFNAEKITDKEAKYFCAILKESERLFNESYSSSRFVLLYNDWRDEDAIKKLKECIKGTKIEFLDFSPIVEANKEKVLIPIDGHPNELWNRELAKFLKEKLNLN